MSSSETFGDFVLLDHDEEQAYQRVIALVRSIRQHNPELAEAFILNALIHTGHENLAEQVQDWIGTVCEVDARVRTAFCHGHGPRPDKIVRLKPMDEFISLPAVPGFQG